MKDALPQIGRSLLIMLGGGSLGWLTGLSATPVIMSVLPGLLTAFIGLASVVAGLQKPMGAEADGKANGGLKAAARAVSVYPLAFLVIGIGAGVPFGLKARAFEWFGPAPEDLVSKWVNLGLKKQVVVARLFDRAEPAVDKDGKSPVGRAHAYLLHGEADTCEQITKSMEGYDLATLRSELQALQLPFAKIGEEIKDVETLRRVVAVLCKPDQLVSEEIE